MLSAPRELVDRRGPQRRLDPTKTFRKGQLVELIRAEAPEGSSSTSTGKRIRATTGSRFDRVRQLLGFEITRTVQDGIGEVARLVRSGVDRGCRRPPLPELTCHAQKADPADPRRPRRRLRAALCARARRERMALREGVPRHQLGVLGRRSYVDRLERALADGDRREIRGRDGQRHRGAARRAAGGRRSGRTTRCWSRRSLSSRRSTRFATWVPWPVFIDAEPQYWQMDPQRVADFLGSDCIQRDAGAVEPAHRSAGAGGAAGAYPRPSGRPRSPIREMAARYGLMVIEDASESLGARCSGDPGRPSGRHRLLQLQWQQAGHDRRWRDAGDRP